MSAEIERNKIIAEWKERAQHDFESAEILLRESSNYDVVVYHAHQAIEKLIKAELLRQEKTFSFTHDINALFLMAWGSKEKEELLEKISYVNSLYPRLRYPGGDQITKEQAQRCLFIAKEFTGSL